ncbi:hypothetical protein LCGC14_1273420 [marine sediment metagenome]|uniref:Uncharacterized protein n=1 Tax=marine sediment metagenome TaxID=412755 RepID=A0A0F9NE32_9ZZZZ
MNIKPKINTSAGLASSLSDETGTGAAVFGTSPTVAAPIITGKTGFNTTSAAGLIHAVLSAGNPVIFGGDVLATVTGVTGTDATPTVLTVSTTNGVAEGDAVIINSGTNATVGTYWVTVVVVDTTVTLDRNASSTGAISAASITYINDPIIIESGSGGGEPRLHLGPGTAAYPAIGWENTGFYLASSGNFRVTIAGSARWRFGGNDFRGNTGNAPLLTNTAATATVPNILSNVADLDTGLGGIPGTGDIISLIAGGVEGIRITEDTTITSRLSDKTSFSNTAEGNTGAMNIQTARNVHTLASAAQSQTTFAPAIPNGSLVLGASFTVNTAVTTSGAGNTWDADFITGLATALVAAGAAGAQDTKANVMIVPEVASNIVNIEFDAPGVETFTGGVIEIIVYYIDLTSLADV